MIPISLTSLTSMIYGVYSPVTKVRRHRWRFKGQVVRPTGTQPNFKYFLNNGRAVTAFGHKVISTSRSSRRNGIASSGAVCGSQDLSLWPNLGQWQWLTKSLKRRRTMKWRAKNKSGPIPTCTVSTLRTDPIFIVIFIQTSYIVDPLLVQCNLNMHACASIASMIYYSLALEHSLQPKKKTAHYSRRHVSTMYGRRRALKILKTPSPTSSLRLLTAEMRMKVRTKSETRKESGLRRQRQESQRRRERKLERESPRRSHLPRLFRRQQVRAAVSLCLRIPASRKRNPRPGSKHMYLDLGLSTQKYIHIHHTHITLFN